ncbi:acetyl esterase/lipase [Mycobacterium sp. BK558]|nr:acetyl esterase/lipase [Mycobacterium sp. BK558]
MRGVSKAAEFAVAAGVGAAVLLGCGCAVASADDSATGGTDTASAQQGPRAARAEPRPRLKSAERRREAAETRRVAIDNRRAARAARADEAAEHWREAAETRRVVLDTRWAARTHRTRVSSERTDDAPTDVAAPLLSLSATPRRKRDTHLDITDGPQTITTRPPSLMDRLILRTLQTLRHKHSPIFDGDGSNLTYTSPPKWVTRKLTITETVYDGMPVWSMSSKKRPTGEYVLGLHGGGLVAEANIINWADYAAMARRTGATVVVPIYPLAPPKGSASVETLVPPMADYLAAMIDAHGAGNVSLYGDSAGGTYAMLVAQELVRRCRAEAACVLAKNQPSRMVLISPVLHLTLSGPIVDRIDDPIIPRRLPSSGSGGPADDPRVNPIMVEDLTGLPPTAIYVGTVERPYPGDLMFRDKLLAQDPDADFTVVIGDGQMHDWALGGIFVNSQARLWRPTIYRQLGLV